MPELSIRKIIEKTLSGEIRIPSFQRGFVWEPEKVAFFIDSLYKGYPIGSLLFWRTNIRLENERQLGNYSLPEPTKGYDYARYSAYIRDKLRLSLRDIPMEHYNLKLRERQKGRDR